MFNMTGKKRGRAGKAAMFAIVAVCVLLGSLANPALALERPPQLDRPITIDFDVLKLLMSPPRNIIASGGIQNVVLMWDPPLLGNFDFYKLYWRRMPNPELGTPAGPVNTLILDKSVFYHVISGLSKAYTYEFIFSTYDIETGRESVKSAPVYAQPLDV